MRKDTLWIGLLCILLLLLFSGAVLLPHAQRAAAGAMAAAPGHAADPRGEVAVPIIMYHSILKDPARAGDYILSPAMLESDLIYLAEHGYETVVVQDLIDYVDGVGVLPEKPVMITLDDGHYNNLAYVLPILERMQMRAVISIVGAYTDRFTEEPDPNPNYAYLSWEEVRELAGSGYVEIQNHSYDMHGLLGRKGSARMRGESEEQYRRLFTEDTQRVQSALLEHTGQAATAYAYPFGNSCEEAEQCLHELGFRASFTCREQGNTVRRGDPESLFGLGRFNRPSGERSAAFMRRAGIV